MKILIKQALVADSNSPFNGQTADLLIENGIITAIGSIPAAGDIQVIEKKGLCVSPGWVDSFANFCDPGFEYKETLESGAAAAAAGGFTDVLVIPNTHPVLHNKAAVEYVVHKSRHLPVQIHPIGAITRNTDGKELAEMYDMRTSGSIAFSDGLHPVQSAGLLLKALQYIRAFDGVIIQLPDDLSINPHGLMHEGIVSTRMGVPGKPVMAEELMIARDIKLTRYAGSRMHFTAVTSPKSLEYIGRAKAAGTAISCSVTPAHLFFSDEDLEEYDTNLKLNPPLRDTEMRDALRQSLREGKIDCIATHHMPHEFDSKVREFEYAQFGMIGLETAFAALQTAVPGLPPAQWADLLAVNPRKIFGLPPATILEGATACITLFQPNESWNVDEHSFKSQAANSPFTGRTLTGKVTGIVTGQKTVLN